MTYIIYDTALNGPYTLMLLQEAYPDNRSLFQGTKDEILSDVAPWLFLVDEFLFEKVNGPLVSLKELVVFRSGENLINLAGHFQQFIYEKINRQENYIRFWDARVLTKFFAAWPFEKITRFFEGIDCFYFIDEQAGTARRCSLNRGKMQNKETRLADIFVTPGALLVKEEINEPGKLESKPVKRGRSFFN